MCEEKDAGGQHNTYTYSGPRWVCHLPARPHHKLQSFLYDRVFRYSYFVTGEDDEAIFSIPGDIDR